MLCCLAGPRADIDSWKLETGKKGKTGGEAAFFTVNWTISVWFNNERNLKGMCAHIVRKTCDINLVHLEDPYGENKAKAICGKR